MPSSAQQLLRAVFSLGNRASSSTAVAALLEVGAARTPAAFLQQGGASIVHGPTRPGVATIASLTRLQRGIHTGLPGAAAAAADDAPTINPLQQTPAPLAARSLLTPSEVKDKEAPLRAKAVLRNIAIGPRKLNMFAKVVRGMKFDDALIQCEISCKKSARILKGVMLSAKANAINNHGLDADKLAVEEAYVGSGIHLKRITIAAKGRSGKRRRYRSHLTIVLCEKEGLRTRTRVIPMLAERYWDIQQRKQQRGL